MINRTKLKLRRGLGAAVLVGGAALAGSPASAGQCPADKIREGVRATGEMKPKASPTPCSA
jgi:hypothetical protein